MGFTLTVKTAVIILNKTHKIRQNLNWQFIP